MLSVASASLAAGLVTPLVFVGFSTSVACSLVNISSAPTPAQVELWGTAGIVLAHIGPGTVPPGETAKTFFDNPNKSVYCRFVNASKSKIRASISTFVTTTGDGSEQLVVPAQ